jgi:CRISPR-associated protein Csh1
MIKEIVEFMDLEGGKFRDIILDNRSLAKGLHIIIDKDNFEIKEFSYNNGSDEFLAFSRKYDLKKREYYCNYLDSNKNFDSSPAKGKNQIHSASPYAIFFRYITTEKEKVTIVERLLEIKQRLLITGYFEKIKSLTINDETINHFSLIEPIIKEKLVSKYFIKKLGKKILLELKNKDYIKIYFDYDIKYIESFYNEYSPEMSFNAKGLFEDKNSYSTKKKYICPISNEENNLGTSSFLNTFADKKPFYLHKTRDKTYGGYTALYTGKVVQQLSLFEELLKLKIKVEKYDKTLFPNPFPIFISNKDAIDNEGNKIYFDLLKDIDNPIGYKEIIKKAYEKISDNNDEVNVLNFYLIFWNNTKDGLRFSDVDYIDSFQFKLKDFEVKNIFELKDFYSGSIDTIFDLEKSFKKFFYTLNGDNENTYMLGNNYFSEKINIPQTEKIPAMVATKFYQYNKSVFDYIYKSKMEIINGYMFDDICISIIREQIKLNSDWTNTYKIKEKLSLYISLHKNFHKGEDLATQIIELKEKVANILEKDEVHLENKEEFAFASGQLIRYILNKNESATKTHSLLDIFISKNSATDFKLVIAQQIQKYSHAFKFFNSGGWFDNLTSEVMAYDLEQKTIKSLVPLIMAGYFSSNVISDKISIQVEAKKKLEENRNGEDSDEK